jgi:beta-lactam-binding protein with PASTA domain
VPNVMGLKMHVALQRLRQIGLSARVEKRVGDNCIVGVVFDQNPQPGTFIRGGSSVGIVVCDRDR